ncbi:MAG: efflux RND transporter permease subunit [Hyphomicrobiales bacterium]
MRLSDLSIKRPVLATVASLLIIVFGIAAALRLPLRELPDIDTSVITVTTNYVGAGPETVDTDITEIIEGAVAGISGVKSINSQSRQGTSSTVIEFEVGRNIDEAANDVRSAVARVRGQLPQEVDEPQVVKNDSDSDPVMRIAVISGRMTPAEITDYVDRFVVDRLATLPGVASVSIFGERKYAMRVWLDRTAMAARNITVADIETALKRSNLDLPSGEVKSLNREFTVKLEGRVHTPEQFSSIVIARVAGYPVKLGDIARIERGVEDEDTVVRQNGEVAVGLGILRQSQANTVEISNRVRQEIEALRPLLPQDMRIEIGADDALFVAASIREVLKGLLEALGLVVLVILLFLRSWRATIIPAVTIPVSLIGCFIFIAAMGYSINVLTLLAIILAIGLVVDDAIVVLENIQRRIDLGETPLVASYLGTQQVTFAVVATSLTLVAVFIPLSFLQGQVGKLFVEFGFVLAAAVLISMFVSLTLCPAIASRILKSHVASPSDDPEHLSRPLKAYRWLLDRCLNMPLVVFALSLLFAGAGFFAFQALPKELTPTEDRGAIIIPVTAPQGSTTAYTDGQMRELENRLMPLKESGVASAIFSITGFQGQPYRGFLVVRLAPWEQRTVSQQQVLREILPKVTSLPGVRAFPTSPAGLGLRGSRTPLSVVIGGPDFDSVKQWANQMLEAAEKNPGLRNAELDYEETQPQLAIDIDRLRAADLGISVETIALTLQTLIASREVTQYVDRGREYEVIVQARKEDRQTPGDLANIFIRAGDGTTLVPLSALVTIRENAAPPTLRRYDRLPSITLTASLAENYSLGQAIDFTEATAREILPPEAKLAFTGQSQQFKEASGGLYVTLVMALLIVFLVLAAQFESFIHPLIIMLTVPLALAAALLAMEASGLSLNIYSQIGMVLLIGLMAKNGILIVEFANQLRDEGRDVRHAVLEASVLRLRPIVMTVVATVLGAVPLMLAVGAGAESRIAIGTVIVGGLGIATVLTLFLTPVLYLVLARHTRPRGHLERLLERELADGSARRAPQAAE